MFGFYKLIKWAIDLSLNRSIDQTIRYIIIYRGKTLAKQTTVIGYSPVYFFFLIFFPLRVV